MTTVDRFNARLLVSLLELPQKARPRWKAAADRLVSGLKDLQN